MARSTGLHTCANVGGGMGGRASNSVGPLLGRLIESARALGREEGNGFGEEGVELYLLIERSSKRSWLTQRGPHCSSARRRTTTGASRCDALVATRMTQPCVTLVRALRFRHTTSDGCRWSWIRMIHRGSQRDCLWSRHCRAVQGIVQQHHCVGNHHCSSLS